MNLPEETFVTIDQILTKAAADGRRALFEFEVYQVLHALGLEVPRCLFIEDPMTVDEKLLKGFGRDLVIKIVSPQIAHKQKLGGVKMVRNSDPLFIQFVLSRMKEEVLSHFTSGSKPEIKGYLLVEFIPFTQALGNEVLIGFKNDPAFGPVITLSKGGDDAEFFARYFDPANLFLPPLDYRTALEMMRTLHIRHKFEQIGHPEYLEYMARATAALSSLAQHYSIIGEKRPAYLITALEINPFVITKDNRFVAVDGFGEFLPVSESKTGLLKVNLHNLDKFFQPQGIAVVGVSADPAKYSLGREIAKLLHDLGRNDLYFINARGGNLTFGNTDYPLYKSLGELPDRVELVVYAAPAHSTIDFMKELNGTSIKAVILISGIPAEIKNSEFARRLSEVVPDGVRIIGPNCMGVFCAPQHGKQGLNTLFIEEKRLEIKSSKNSNTVFLTQSGAFSVTAIDKLQNARVLKNIVSFGNKYDVKITDLIAYFSGDASTQVLALYIEGLDPGEGRQFFDLARQIDKPLIVYKAGRTEAGARAAASHTASMSGSYDVFKAACLQAGVILAENIEDHYDYLKVFSLLANKIPGGNRVAGVVNAGFESTVGADELKNLEQARLSEATIVKLNQINKYGLVDVSSPFLDITPMADDRMYADFVEAVLQDEGVDCVFVAVVPHAVSLKTTPDTCRDPDSLANLLVSLSNKYQKPMVISVNAGRYYQDFVSIMEENGLPVHTDIRSAIKSLDRFVSHHVKTAT